MSGVPVNAVGNTKVADGTVADVVKLLARLKVSA
jgi:hypothetical protein